jgi:hypothetical protein
MHIRYARFAAFVLFIAFTLTTITSAAKQQSSDKAEPFSGAVAEQLMRQVRDGLVASNPDKILGAFDPDNTPSYSDFADQLRAFFDKWENIRVHYQILQTGETKCATAECGESTAQFEMEAEDVQSQLPAMRRGAQLQLTFQRGDKGWKIVNLTPRDLFR